MKDKKIPLRKCMGCNEMKEKKELVRVVKAPDEKSDDGSSAKKGEVSLDLSGKKPGRGAYICHNPECLKKARKARRFERVFSMKISEEIFEQMEQEICSI